ncbi:hypothetical protein TrST_g4091 [Triparma strigata]|uniref:PPM-type phosphatase domain-containing protein n=1 Tax=Triparma strigata TaxID=1606541 RepID=A0A9W7AX29_9STRA|nr:hypothetical protein TrST_g4091 [Triparma strigata]
MATVAPGGEITLDAYNHRSIGGRHYQEDRAKAIDDLNELIPESTKGDRSIRRALYCVFDGHGGDACSEFLFQNFHKHLLEKENLCEDPKAAIMSTWDECEEQFQSRMTARYDRNAKGFKPKKEGDKPKFPGDGSTATVCLIEGNKVYIASCGDSSAAVIRTNKSLEKFTREHHTVDPEEVARIEAAGGELVQKTIKTPAPFPFCCTKMVDKPLGKPRVYPGGLLVTRAFGDFQAKLPVAGGIPGSIIHTCDPIREVMIEDDWQYFVVASDGIWDGLTDEQVPKVLKQELDDAQDDYGKGDDNKEKVRKRVVKGFVESATDSEFWRKNQCDADNTTAIILFFK